MRTTPVNAGYTIINGVSTGTRGTDVDCWIEYAVLSNSITANTSALRVVLYAAATFSSGTAWNNPENFGYVGYNGSNKQYRNTTYNFGNMAVNCFGDHTYIIAHNPDGSAAVTLEGAWNTSHSSYISGGSVSGIVNLPTIPRYATLTSAPDFNDEENPTITYSNPAGDVITSLQACISLDGSQDNIPYRDISKSGGSYTFHLSGSERILLRQSTLTANSRNVIFFIRSSIGGNVSYSTLNRKFTIKDPSPVLSPSIEDVNSLTSKLTGDSSVIIPGYSNARINIGASAVKEATISRQSVVCGNQTLNGDGVIDGAQSGTFAFSVTDSRGNTTQTNVQVQTIPYIPLTCNLNKVRIDGEGNMLLNVSGNYFNGNFSEDTPNTLSVKYQYKLPGGEYTPCEPMEAAISGNTYTAQIELDGFDYHSLYIVRAYAEDALGKVYSVEYSVRAVPVFDWGESDFQFHVPVGMNGLSIGGLADPVSDNDAAKKRYVDEKVTTAVEEKIKSIGVVYTSENGSGILAYAGSAQAGSYSSAGIILITDMNAPGNYYFGRYYYLHKQICNISPISSAGINVVSNSIGTVSPTGGSGNYKISVIPFFGF